jgi:alanine dehydrogenase
MAQPSGFKQVLEQSAGLFTQEKMAPTDTKAQSLVLGVPRELSANERRIALTPASAALLVRNGHEIVVETNAGKAAGFTDHEFAQAGAYIAQSAAEVFKAKTILKIDAPIAAEIELMSTGATIISALQVAHKEANYYKSLNEKKITGLAFEMIEDRAGGLPVTRAMSEIAGNTAIHIAAELLSSHGKGIILGGITGVPPTKVVILGAGTVAEYAAKAALGLGADIKIFDQEVYRLKRIKYALGQNIYTSVIDSDTLADAIERADVVIGAIRGKDGQSPCVVTEQMVSKMAPNSIIIDVCIDQGGCFETSQITDHQLPHFRKQDVIHYGVPNIASRVPATASTALSNIFTPYLLKSGELGGLVDYIFNNKNFAKSVYCFAGSLTNLSIAQRMGMRYKDLSLLSAIRQ